MTEKEQIADLEARRNGIVYGIQTRQYQALFDRDYGDQYRELALWAFERIEELEARK